MKIKSRNGHEILLATSNRAFSGSFQKESLVRDFVLDTVLSPRDFDQLSKKKIAPEMAIVDLDTMGKNLSRVIYHLNQMKEDIPILIVSDKINVSLLDKATKNLSVVLSLPSPTTKQGFKKLINHIYDFLNEDLKKKLCRVEYLKNEDVFACTFENKEIFFIHRKDIPEDPKALSIEACKINLDQYSFDIQYNKTGPITVPWDFIRSVADKNDEFYAGNKKKNERLSAEEIGKRIIETREKKEMTQDQLALKTGILRNNISRIENGRHYPSLPILEKIAKALELPVASLLTPP